ncbi:MAG: hypothetical protein A4E28_01256 [Methanocella sp. PtaU1.Bin125]|nr:MAG: hypothetical protein A4E28_01256 [Methanocella sp. PtaU1.Bin125]
MTTRVVQIKCPECNSPITARQVDMVFVCDACGVMHTYADGKPVRIEYETAAVSREAADGRVYLPFWKLDVAFNVKRSKVKGGYLYKLGKFLDRDSSGGRMAMMLPAFDVAPEKYKELAESLTLEPPAYAVAPWDRAAGRVPCIVAAGQTQMMADFLFVTIEAEKPGIMQELDYDLEVKSQKLVYLPYYKAGGRLEPAY